MTVEFGVTVNTGDGGKGVQITVWQKRNAGEEMQDFAQVFASTVQVAVEMAVPYMVAVAEQDPFTNMLMRRSGS